MSSVWKTPCGSDAMPEMVVKIIGSKHFRYLVENPKIKEKENMNKTHTALQKSVTGNAKQMSREPPAPVNPPAQQTKSNPDDVEDSKNQPKPILTGTQNSRILKSKANVHCSSVPTGDQSLSYIHGLPRRNFRDWSLEQMAREGSEQPEDIGQRPSKTTREDTFLLSLVRRELKSCPLSSSLLDKIQKELKILDPISSGYLLQSQLSRLFLRHEVPLKLPTIKILCHRFSGRSSPEMVNYEKLLWFLNIAASNDPEPSRTVVDSIQRKPQSPTNENQSTSPQDSDLHSKVNKSLLEILKMALKTVNCKLNIDNLNLSFRKEDRSFSGCLPLPKVRAICGKHGLYLTLSLLETLLNYQDLGYQNEIKWQNFVALLSRASSDVPFDLPTGKNENEVAVTPAEPEIPEVSESKNVHIKTSEEELQPDSPSAKTPSSKEPVNLLKIRPVSQPFVDPVMKTENEECETWIDRFRKLENALYLCDLNNTGVLEKQRARRLIHNYNLIYNLSLSPLKIDQALRRFRSGENMLLEPALRYLKEL
ncbi:PREDICTED: uncharacterized protein C1orf87 homolog [Chrysochloris asiatica]|uniref:Uncharacterized protein C1orf87 homolog n=1 Tax=Chrysochloris asiatica TaxID=185453 RepID=A0A9B0TEF6_CHRAS|nr:PREDICTED: uncharacterized protein C1orf87 homolog [Chrysochloris asiatica]